MVLKEQATARAAHRLAAMVPVEQTQVPAAHRLAVMVPVEQTQVPAAHRLAVMVPVEQGQVLVARRLAVMVPESQSRSLAAHPLESVPQTQALPDHHPAAAAHSSRRNGLFLLSIPRHKNGILETLKAFLKPAARSSPVLPVLGSETLKPIAASV
jgi:hypothetical protein